MEILARQTGQSGAPRVVTARARPAAPAGWLLARAAAVLITENSHDRPASPGC